MSRSSYKLIKPNVGLISVTPNLIKLKKYSNSFIQSKSKKFPDLLCWSPNLILGPSLLNKRLAVHTGKNFALFQIKPSMILFRSGVLRRTKKLGSLIHALKKKKKKK